MYDPYLPAEAADMLGFTQTSLERVMQMDVVISLVPQSECSRDHCFKLLARLG